MEDTVKNVARGIEGFYTEIAEIPAIKRGKVWCRKCGREEDVSDRNCFKVGWPKCCGHTMTIDHPDTW